jgi:hydroxypyruvate reductase
MNFIIAIVIGGLVRDEKLDIRPILFYTVQMKKLHNDAGEIIRRSIEANLPGAAVRHALEGRQAAGDVSLLAIGKAAWTMAEAAYAQLGDRITRGLVITKYGHSQGPIADAEIIEAGHPVSDENTILGAEKAILMARALSEAARAGKNGELLFLVSGGGSALFEKPQDGISLDDIAGLNRQLLASGADIVEINTIRKRLSAVKGGRFAQLCAPARVFTVVLSDVLGDRLDSIASGPAAPDLTTADDARRIVEKYRLALNPAMAAALDTETPKTLDNVESVITGSVRTLCASAAEAARELGYAPLILCDDLDCEASEAGKTAAAIARRLARNDHADALQPPCAVIMGGETVVHLKDADGKGGRNQEIALTAAGGIAGLDNVLIFSLGSDGTDGPTDAAGGIVDGGTAAQLKAKGVNLARALAHNDSYNALAAVDGLIKTGPTGTNVNDITVILCA